MARKVKFALEMADGTKVRSNLEELREHFDMESIISYYLSGKLLEWLEDRYYDDEAAKIAELDKDAPNLNAQLCAIIGVDASKFDAIDVEALERLNKKKSILRQKTSDTTIIENAMLTALNQEDLADLLDLESPVIYLCGEKFNIPIRVEHKKYIGVLGTPKIEIRATSNADLKEKDIVFENVVLPWITSTKSEKDGFAESTNNQETNSHSICDVIPLEELKDLYKSSFSQRIKKYNFLEDTIWELVNNMGEPIKDETLSNAQKKVALRLLCKNKYSENDVAHVCITKDFTSGWAFTKNSFCIYQKQNVESVVIPYKDIASVANIYDTIWNSVSTMVLDYVVNSEIIHSQINADGAFADNFGPIKHIANYLDVVKNIFAE